MNIVNEFKAFIARGNVIDLAVGVIMGASFGKIVSSLVDDVVMPPIGYLIGGISFKDLSLQLPEVTVVDKVLPAVEVKYGLFLQNLLSFLIIAVCVFLLIKAVNTFMKKQQAPVIPSSQEKLLMEIRDLLKTKP